MRRVITIVLTVMMVLGISMFGYACYAVEECEQVESYFTTQAAQQTYLVDYLVK
jgi:hypothetical protein